MLSDFLAFIEVNNLFTKEDRIILAVSGGIDSVVMSHLFKSSAYNFAIAHCNFKLRGEASDKDEQFVKDLADNMGVPIFIKQFETKKYASDHGISTQLAARELRYQWFDDLLKEKDYKYLATAHHINDSFETVLYNLVKGTGIHGITGVPVKNGQIIRPLLFANRNAVSTYARDKSIRWREDQSNQSNDYNRNLIRNEVVPILKTINPGLDKTFESTLQRLQGAEEIFSEAVENFKAKYVKHEHGDWYYNIDGLKSTSIALIDELFKSFGFNFSQAKDLKSALGEVGKIFYSATHQLLVDREYVILTKKNAGKQKRYLGTIEEGQSIFENDNVKLDISQETIYPPVKFEKGVEKFDAEKLKYPLVVRKWREGDYFYPIGMKGKKKLSDFMIDNKIPLNLKQRVHVLESEGKIVWVIGYRPDDRFKVTSETKHIVSFRIQSHD